MTGAKIAEGPSIFLFRGPQGNKTSLCSFKTRSKKKKNNMSLKFPAKKQLIKKLVGYLQTFSALLSECAK